MTSHERAHLRRGTMEKVAAAAAAVAFAAFVVNKRVREKMRNVSGWVKRHEWVQAFPPKERGGEFPAKEGTSVSVYALIHDPAQLYD